MWTKAFWKDAIERGVKTAAQVAVGLLVGLSIGEGFDWQTFLISFGTTVGLSFVTSILSSLVGSPNNASLVGSIITSTWFCTVITGAGVLAVILIL